MGAHGADEEPSFVMRAVKYHRTALYRQLGEAVRIRRRGGQGSILNSKAEYDRCYIPRLIVEEKDTREQELMEEQESLKSKEQQEEEEEQWSNVKLMSRNHQDRIESSKIGAFKKSSSKKREQEQVKIPRSKKLKHEVLGEQWGWEQPTPIQEEQELPREPTVPEEQQALVEPMLPSLEPPPSPKEQRPNRRSRQSKLTTFLVQRPPEPAAEMNDSGGSEVGTQQCVFNEDDICVLHGVLSTKVKVTKLKWKYLGKARGYGYANTKVLKNICKAKNLVPVSPDISTQSEVSRSDIPRVKGKANFGG